ncbi:MAG: radical SAM protein [Candidatus Saelkia tenebricola]|nr:radical SAM protein [Candidatus Saelkia tenebricola]
MMKRNYKYIYGPVPSWRLGSSLGIDPISGEEKICTFDCIYCQLGRTKNFTDERKVFVPVAEIIKELDLLPSVQIDYITFSGAGEPTLAKNLGQMIKAIKKIRNEKIAVLTNSSLIDREDVREDLLLADFVAVKLDAVSQEVFKIVNMPLETIKFNTVLNGIKDFKNIYKGKLALQIMFMPENKKCAQDIARIVKEINPDEVQINTPLRPCGVEPLSMVELDEIKGYFKNLNSISVYDAEKKKVKPISNEDTLKRRGKI